MSALRRFTTNGNTHINGRYCDANEAMELIEHQQQRIAELERERDELAAHVELVKKIFITLNSCHLNSDWNENAGKLRSVIMQTPTTILAEHDAEVARKAVEEYKRSITEPNAIVHRYPIVDLNGFYLPGADGRPMLVYGHIDNAESPSHQAFIKCVIGRLLELLNEIQEGNKGGE